MHRTVASSLDGSDVAGADVPDKCWRLVAAIMHWVAPRPVAVGTVTSDVNVLIVETPAALDSGWTCNPRDYRTPPRTQPKQSVRPRQARLQLTISQGIRGLRWQRRYSLMRRWVHRKVLCFA